MALTDVQLGNACYTARTPYGFALKFDPAEVIIASACCNSFLSFNRASGDTWHNRCISCGALAVLSVGPLGYGASWGEEHDYLERAIEGNAGLEPLELFLKTEELVTDLAAARVTLGWP